MKVKPHNYNKDDFINKMPKKINYFELIKKNKNKKFIYQLKKWFMFDKLLIIIIICSLFLFIFILNLLPKTLPKTSTKISSKIVFT